MLIKLSIGKSTAEYTELSFVHPVNSAKNFAIEPPNLKHFAAIFGANACGKTTLLFDFQKIQTCLKHSVQDFRFELFVVLNDKIYEYFLVFDNKCEVVGEYLRIENTAIDDNWYLTAIDRDRLQLKSDFDCIKSIRLKPDSPALASIDIRAPEVVRLRSWIENIRFVTDLGDRRDLDEIQLRYRNNAEQIENFVSQFDLKFDWGKLVDRELSSGECKLYEIAPILTDPNLQLLVWDDLNAHLHPIVVDRVLDFCRDRGIQVIFTANLPSLFGRLDREDIWLLEKGDLRSIVEYKIAPTTNLERAYLDGRFGAIPFVNIQQFT